MSNKPIYKTPVTTPPSQVQASNSTEALREHKTLLRAGQARAAKASPVRKAALKRWSARGVLGENVEGGEVICTRRDKYFHTHELLLCCNNTNNDDIRRRK